LAAAVAVEVNVRVLWACTYELQAIAPSTDKAVPARRIATAAAASKRRSLGTPKLSGSVALGGDGELRPSPIIHPLLGKF
jgi:hypothetical protein